MSGVDALAGKVAVVTGAAQGLGRAYAEALSAAGVTVAGVDVTDDGSDAVAVRLVADVSDLDDVCRVRDEVAARLGGVDILVNNAARWRPTPIDSDRGSALADFEELFGTNTKGAFLMQRAFVGALIERGGGDIVNVSTCDVLPPPSASHAATNPPTTDVYNASKWALNGFTQEWALTLRKHRVRVNAIAMDATDTPMQRAAFGAAGPPADVVATWMTPAEQAQLLLELLAEGPDGRTGETIGSWRGDPVALPPRRARGEDIR